MTQKTRQEKEISRLRREIEVLRAQTSGQNSLSVQGEAKVTPPPSLEAKALPKPESLLPKNLEKAGIQRVDPKFIKADLLKTTVLSLLSLAVILVVYLLRANIPFFK